MARTVRGSAARTQADWAKRWREHIDAQASSERTQEAYCRAHGLSLRAFRRWKYRKLPQLEREGRSSDPSRTPARPEAPPTFLPVDVVFDRDEAPRATSPSVPSAAAAGVEVVLPDDRVRLALRRDFDAESLRRAVEALGC